MRSRLSSDLTVDSCINRTAIIFRSERREVKINQDVIDYVATEAGLGKKTSPN